MGGAKQARVLGIAEITLLAGREVYGFVEKEECERLVSYSALDDPRLYAALSEIGLAAWRRLACRDGGRVDMRLDARGQPQVLEINTLPGMHPTHSDLPIIASYAGMSYNQLVDAIIVSASQRIA